MPDMYNTFAIQICAAMAQSVERILGKDEVTGSIPVTGTRKEPTFVYDKCGFFSTKCALRHDKYTFGA